MEILPRQKWGSLLNNNNEAEDPYSFNGKFMAVFFLTTNLHIWFMAHKLLIQRQIYSTTMGSHFSWKIQRQLQFAKAPFAPEVRQTKGLKGPRRRRNCHPPKRRLGTVVRGFRWFLRCSVLFVCCFVWLVTWLVFLFCCMCVRLVGCFFCLVSFFVCWVGLVGLLGWAVGSWMRKQQKLKGRFVGLPF